jgi:hypothetical protein
VSAVNICRERDCACQEVAPRNRCSDCPEHIKAFVNDRSAALARKDALLRQAREALNTAESEMRDWHFEHPARKEIADVIAAIDAELKEQP